MTISIKKHNQIMHEFKIQNHQLIKQKNRYKQALNDILNNDEMYVTNEEIILEALEG